MRANAVGLIAKPNAEDPHMRFDWERVALAKPMRGSFRCNVASKLAVAVFVATMAVVCAGGVTLSLDRVKQRYPWNGLVDIDYTITNDTDVPLGIDDNIEVLMVDNSTSPAVTNRALTFLQAPLPVAPGKHRVTWCANADGVSNRVELAEFHVKIVHYVESYMVIDVSAGPGEDAVYHVDFLNGVPPSGFNVDEYKGCKIVLRRIHPGSYVAGSPSSPAEAGRTAAREKQHRVAISKPFYIGIFEITQQQYLQVMDVTNPSDQQGERWQHRPVEKVSYNQIRGGEWPTSADPTSGTFIDKLLKKCRSQDPDTGVYDVPVAGFDLPTEFQWEYACRAGTTKAFNRTDDFNNGNVGELTSELDQVGRYQGNQSKGVGGISTAHTIVGSYLPNAWGLYDMHGNVWEWCRDRYVEDVAALKQYVDPAGAASGSSHVGRGGAWNYGYDQCRSAYRNYYDATYVNRMGGFRLSRDVR